MSWRIIWATDAQRDLDRLEPGDRETILDALFGWLEQGPPRGSSRTVAGVNMFEDEVSGARVTYFVSDADLYAAVIRVRRA